jgi:site-specific recombinase XerD
VIAALNFACEMGWVQPVPRIRKVKASKLRHAKGRPITLEEFERLLAVTEKVVGKVISRIGEKAGVVVRRDGSRPKYASVHDLRRSLAERLLDTGVLERIVSRVMRHASPQTTQRYYAPRNVQPAARVLRAMWPVG